MRAAPDGLAGTICHSLISQCIAFAGFPCLSKGNIPLLFVMKDDVDVISHWTHSTRKPRTLGSQSALAALGLVTSWQHHYDR